MVVVAVGTIGRAVRLMPLLPFVSWELAGIVVFVSPDEDVFPSLNVERSEEVAVEEGVVVGSCAFWADWIPKAESFCGGVETSIC